MASLAFSSPFSHKDRKQKILQETGESVHFRALIFMNLYAPAHLSSLTETDTFSNGHGSNKNQLQLKEKGKGNNHETISHFL